MATTKFPGLTNAKLTGKAFPNKPNLAATLAKAKKSTELINAKSPLEGLLQKPKPTVETVQENVSKIPAVSKEKYKVRADVPESFPVDVMEQFVENMQSILDAMGTASLHNVMERTLKYAQDHPELREILVPEDIQIFARGARASYAAVVVEKTERKTKATKKSKKNSEMVEFLNDLDLDL